MNKYNNIKCVVDGIKFDSRTEADYYIYLKNEKLKSRIQDFELQPKFLLQPKFKKNNKTYREINYVADFKIYMNDGTIMIVDIKGFKTTEFKLKQKLFEYKYPDLQLICLTYVKKHGGWVDLEALEQIRRDNRRKK